MRRPIPSMKGLPPALRMRSATDRALACRWHLATFPIHYRSLCSIELQNYLHDLKLLTKKKTSPIRRLSHLSPYRELERSEIYQSII